MRILIVEDDALTTEVVRDYLSPYSSSIHYAQLLEDAFSYLERLKFDLVILDLRLPDSTADNTIDCIGEVRAIQEQAAIVVFSGMTPMEYFRKRSLDAGADVFLAKTDNFTRNALYLAVVAAVKQRHNGSPAEIDERIQHHVEVLEKIAATP